MPIKLNIDIGDVILTGKFKNKRTTVKSIGTDELGQPTINGKPMLKFRIEKLLPQDKKSKKTKEMQQEQKQSRRKEMKITKKQLKEMIQKEAKKQLKEQAGTTPASEDVQDWIEDAISTMQDALIIDPATPAREYPELKDILAGLIYDVYQDGYLEAKMKFKD